MGADPVATGAAALGATLVAVLVAAGQRRGRTARRARTWEKPYVVEDRDPTTLPLYQRDYSYAWNVVRRTMLYERAKGRKFFWDVRVTARTVHGCKVEEMKTGLPCMIFGDYEGPNKLEVGAEVKAECIWYPNPSYNNDIGDYFPKLNGYTTKRRMMPVMSHRSWLESEKRIKFAQTLEAGQIITGEVVQFLPKGLLMDLEGGGGDGAKGLLRFEDISNVCSQKHWVSKHFPIGFKMPLYVVHSDKENGRITLSTKEFEDDEHIGWMINFPERLFAKAEFYAEKYKQKRKRYIAWMQR